MTIFLFNLLLAFTSTPLSLDGDMKVQPRNDLERRILAPADSASRLTEEWLFANGGDRQRIEAALTRAGFTLGRLQGRCRWFTYLRQIGTNGLERSAAVGLCPDKPFVLITTGFLSKATKPGPGAPLIVPIKPR